MIITLLLWAIALAAIVQPSTPRFCVAMIFAVVTLSHDFLSQHTEGLTYYGSAALADLLIIILTSGVLAATQIAPAIHRICIFSMAANFIGWALWFFYLPPIVYEVLFIGIYSWAIIILFKKDVLNVGVSALGGRNASIHRNNYPRSSINRKVIRSQ